jgi:hypothetical protein
MADTEITPEPAAVRLVPEGIARMLRFAPISAGPRTLTIAVAQPLSGAQLSGVIEVSGRQLVNQLELGAAAVDALIEAAYGGTAQASSASAA